MIRPRTFLVSLSLLVTTLVVANAPLLPVSAPSIASAAGGVGILDLEPQPTADAVHAALVAYGSSRRTTYLWELATVDLLLPVLAAVTLVLALRLVLRRVVSPGSRWHLLAWAPIVPSAIDYVENLGIAALLLAYPRRIDSVATVLAPLTAVKSILYIGALTLLAAALLAWAIQRVSRASRGDVRARPR